MNKRRGRDKRRQPVPQVTDPATANPRQVVQRMSAATFSGPLPPPEILVQYNDVVPNGAERIIALAERQAEHRMALENRVIDADIRRSNWGLGVGFLVSLAWLLVSYLVIHEGHAVAGVFLGSLDLVGLVGVFVYGTATRRGERKERFKMMSGQS